jgi:hypothetical protein
MFGLPTNQEFAVRMVRQSQQFAVKSNFAGD